MKRYLRTSAPQWRTLKPGEQVVVHLNGLEDGRVAFHVSRPDNSGCGGPCESVADALEHVVMDSAGRCRYVA